MVGWEGTWPNKGPWEGIREGYSVLYPRKSIPNSVGESERERIGETATATLRREKWERLMLGGKRNKAVGGEMGARVGIKKECWENFPRELFLSCIFYTLMSPSLIFSLWWGFFLCSNNLETKRRLYFRNR